jgi:anti-anti-sigma factor
VDAGTAPDMNRRGSFATSRPTERRFFIRGEIDIANAGELRADLEDEIRAHDGDIVVDCCGLTFIDSSGLAALIQAQHQLHDLGRTMRVTNVDHMTERLFDIMGLTDELHVNDN